MKILFAVLALSLCVSAQVIYLGPLNSPPIDPSQCKPSPDGQTGLCFTNAGVHVSISGAAFGPPLPQGQKGDPGPQGIPGADGAQGLKGDPGPKGDSGPQGQQGVQGIQGQQGLQGPAGTYPQSFTLTCAASPGSIPKGFTSKCTITVP